MTLVSVIINCYNSESYLKETLDSVLKQTYKNLEIIVWDNKSTDNTASIVKNFKDTRIKYFLSQKHTFLGEARNMAIQQSSGKLISFIDSDDIWLPTKLEKQVQLFDQDDVGIVICDTLYFNNKNYNKQLYKKKNHRQDLFSVNCLVNTLYL